MMTRPGWQVTAERAEKARALAARTAEPDRGELAPGGVTVEELRQACCLRTTKAARDLLQSLVDAGELVREEWPDGRRGPNPFVYRRI